LLKKVDDCKGTYYLEVGPELLNNKVLSNCSKNDILKISSVQEVSVGGKQQKLCTNHSPALFLCNAIVISNANVVNRSFFIINGKTIPQPSLWA